MEHGKRANPDEYNQSSGESKIDKEPHQSGLKTLLFDLSSNKKKVITVTKVFSISSTVLSVVWQPSTCPKRDIRAHAYKDRYYHQPSWAIIHLNTIAYQHRI